MGICNFCKNDFGFKVSKKCVNCGAILCTDCIKETNNVCPYCNSTLGC